MGYSICSLALSVVRQTGDLQFLAGRQLVLFIGQAEQNIFTRRITINLCISFNMIQMYQKVVGTCRLVLGMRFSKPRIFHIHVNAPT